MTSSLSLYDLLKIRIDQIFFIFLFSILSGILLYLVNFSFIIRLKVIIISSSVFIVSSLSIASLSFYLEEMDKSGIHMLISSLMLLCANTILVYIICFIIFYDFK